MFLMHLTVKMKEIVIISKVAAKDLHMQLAFSTKLFYIAPGRQNEHLSCEIKTSLSHPNAVANDDGMRRRNPLSLPYRPFTAHRQRAEVNNYLAQSMPQGLYCYLATQ